ncbi:30S ribosomal protein S8 [Candidatus Woesearchaeota archaeon]|jgi:small subunit ribosomal protein S8|nr:30S ribosomal protein S8 [Candidatus Woesearchaeota archaeon]MBT5271915.1 30S ribosomal protein S8 [Candidatus Woesearchaeota archaeon]MBT6041027.1 30S ribosomal protein S8 [Candidatus Woesearchaeota archaeon]MBT6336203.1 30S ribosomal protein S8 [Candidatus Woesearchaeota archaeon]MBT7928030.1 30S ribosomal protein S8 [Candidatus Woesearchaeota archaeon]
MVLNDVLANVYSHILNCENLGKKTCRVRPKSKMVAANLTILQDEGFIGEFKEVDDGKGGYIEINLLNNINKCGVIKPRYAVKKDQFDKFEKRFLPARNMGLLIISTPKGLMTHNNAKSKDIGGKLIAYCY